MKTPFSRTFFEKEYDSTISNEKLDSLGVGALRLAAREGDEKRGCFLAGQVASMVKNEQPAAEIIREMFEQAELILGGAKRWVK
ncbi:hypothetical protein SDC9_186131 [bioreactor metagenome]|uniref:Nitronate monooxygenase domain-containing protein n=1 Tax=bioreactor metagenome TaxID=1076179 RepID=A0A645HI20_9ZZZZ